MNSIISPRYFCIGIIGGMGPMAGVLLQQLIIRETPAGKDQDHLQVVCFTNPKIPDRTISLKENNGQTFVSAIQETGNVLTRMGATVLVMACNTAHARSDEIQKGLSIPLVSLVDVTVDWVTHKYSSASAVGLLGTDGLLEAGVYQSALGRKNFECLVPSPFSQRKLMEIIYAIKVGKSTGVLEGIQEVIHDLQNQGVDVVLLGCTELSLYFDQLEYTRITVEDPLRIVATHLVSMSKML